MALQATVKRLLVVEDDPDQSRAVRERLELYGYAVSCAQDGRIAMDLLQALGFEPPPSSRPSASCRHPPSPASCACACDVCFVVPSSGREAIQSGVRLYREAIWNRSIQAGRTRMFWSGIPAGPPCSEADSTRSPAAWKMT